jgi:hypothetical protein
MKVESVTQAVFLICTPRATPSTVGNQEEQQIQPIRNREKVKNRS